MKKWLLALGLLIPLAGAAWWFAVVPASPVPDGVESRDRLQPGPYRVIAEDFHAVDNSRDTPPNRDIPGHPGRNLDGEIWRPDGLREPGPLVVYSHGFTSYHAEAVYLTTFLASHGYTVIAVDFPLTGFRGEGEPLVTDVVNQPGDVSFLIDTLLARNTEPGDTLYQTIDPDRIAAAGVSLGGLTTTLVAFHPKLKDPRIHAAVSIAGPTTLFTPAYFADSAMPYLMVYGDADVIVPYKQNALPVIRERPGTILVTIKGASHVGFAQTAATFMRLMDNPDTLGCEVVQRGLADQQAGDSAELIAAIGTAADGINVDTDLRVCATQPPEQAMPAAREHMYTKIAVYAFLQSVFAPEQSTREAARRFLLKDLPEENSKEITVTE